MTRQAAVRSHGWSIHHGSNPYLTVPRIVIRGTARFQGFLHGLRSSEQRKRVSRMFKDTTAFASFSVNDVDVAEKFYGETLGLDVQRNAMGYLDLTLSGGARIMVYP